MTESGGEVAGVSSGVLAGVRVVEFSQNAAVPQCARLLAGMGADVVKVEPVTGDAMRHLTPLSATESRAFASINPGKRGICLDYAGDGAADVIHGLLGWADIALVGLKLGDVARYGLDWDRARAVNPRLVHLIFTAFGPEGPDADQGGYDVLVQGLSGLGWAMNRSADGVPQPSRPAFIDFASGSTAAAAVLAALRHRDLTGEGQRVDASLLGSAIALGTPMLSAYEHDADGVQQLRDDIALLRAAGADFDAQREVYEKRVTTGALVFRLYFRPYLTADGLISVAGMSPGLIAKFHELIGLDRLPSGTDPNSEEAQAVIAAAEALFATRTTAEWEVTLRDIGYPCARYNMPIEAANDPQVRANDYVVDLEHPEIGAYATAGMPFNFSETPTRISGPSPRLGEHTTEVLIELGFDAVAIERLTRAKTVRLTPE